LGGGATARLKALRKVGVYAKSGSRGGRSQTSRRLNREGRDGNNDLEIPAIAMLKSGLWRGSEKSSAGT